MPLMEPRDLGKILVLLGLGLAAMGFFLWAGAGKDWLGKLPGDVHIRRGNFTFHFPVATCLLLSVLITFVIWLFRGR